MTTQNYISGNHSGNNWTTQNQQGKHEILDQAGEIVDFESWSIKYSSKYSKTSDIKV
ncbi:MAG: hypothetical protein Fur0046_19580 [Cyanobacteria bacterium J069]